MQKNNIAVDSDTLNKSYRNHHDICLFANKIYPEFEPCLSFSKAQTGHDGIFLVLRSDVEYYLKKYNPVQLRHSKKIKVNDLFSAMNFGNSKGLTFDRVLVYPTKPMKEWLYSEKELNSTKSKAQLYVAITRAKYSVAFVAENLVPLDGVQHYTPNVEQTQ